MYLLQDCIWTKPFYVYQRLMTREEMIQIGDGEKEREKDDGMELLRLHMRWGWYYFLGPPIMRRPPVAVRKFNAFHVRHLSDY